MVRDLGTWSVDELASAAAENIRAQMRVECNLLRIAAEWALKHPGDGLPFDVKINNGADIRRVVVPGDGCPDVAEDAASALATETRMTPGQAHALIRDAVGLRFRFPLLWARIEAGNVPAWQARRVVEQTQMLSLDQAASVDRSIAGYLGALSLTRLDNRIQAEILRVDTAAREKAAQAGLKNREVRFGRADDNNMTSFWGSMPAGDAVITDANLDRLADVLMARKDDLPAGVPARGASSKEEWRSVALALYTGNPVLVTQLLGEAQHPDLFNDLFAHADTTPGTNTDTATNTGTTPGTAREGSTPTSAEGHDSSDYKDVDHEDAGHKDADGDGLDQTADSVREQLIAEVVNRIDPTKLLPNVTLYAHVNAEAFLKSGHCSDGDSEAQIARIEGIGPALLPTIRTWLGDGANIRLQPILDPDGIQPVDRYETPDRMRDALLARTPASVFP